MVPLQLSCVCVNCSFIFVQRRSRIVYFNSSIRLHKRNIKKKTEEDLRDRQLSTVLRKSNM